MPRTTFMERWGEPARTVGGPLFFGKQVLQPSQVREVAGLRGRRVEIRALGPSPPAILDMTIGEREVASATMPVGGAVHPFGLRRVTIAKRTDVERATDTIPGVDECECLGRFS